MTNSVANKLMDKLQSQVNEYSKEYLDLQIQIKQLSDKQNQLKEKLKNTLTELEVNEITTDEYKVIFTEYTKNTFDSKRFAEEHKILYKKYLKTTNSSKFEVKIAK